MDANTDKSPQCPSCGSLKIHFQESTPTHDYVYIDTIATCWDCGSELNIQYSIKTVTLDNYR